MNKLKPYNSKAIISNIELVLRSGDITKLNITTYRFITMMSGFIAHYDLYGFQSHYSDVSQLAKELKASVKAYTPDFNYEVSSYGEDYATSKKIVYTYIPSLVDRYEGKLTTSFENKAKEALENTYNLIGECLKRDDNNLILAMVNKLELAY